MMSSRVKLISCPTSRGRLMPMSVMPRIAILLLVYLLLVTRLEHEADHDGDDEGVDRDRLGEGDAQDHVRLDHRLRLWVAPQRLHRLADEVADCQAGAEAADADGQRRSDELQRLVAYLQQGNKHLTPPLLTSRFFRRDSLTNVSGAPPRRAPPARAPKRPARRRRAGAPRRRTPA